MVGRQTLNLPIMVRIHALDLCRVRLQEGHLAFNQGSAGSNPVLGSTDITVLT